MSLTLSLGYSVRRRYLDRDLAGARAAMAGRVLEIGSGRAGTRGRFERPVTGIISWTHVDRDGLRQPHVRAMVERLPFGPHAFDTVVCLEVLEYVWQPAHALVELRRVLKPGGALVLSTPFFHRTDADDDYWRFTEPALRRLLGEAGFEVVQCHAQGHALAAAVNVLQYVLSVQTRWRRRALAFWCRPIFGALLSADARTAGRRPDLAAFSTGYLVVARATGGQAA
ncbi:MAG: class I SAM-dependent methyltransferase [Acidobacteriota bacterium]